jgi:hypothetical protein
VASEMVQIISPTDLDEMRAVRFLPVLEICGFGGFLISDDF